MTDPALAIAAPFIAGFEGFRSGPYRDGGGVITQGYGCTIHPNGERVGISDVPVTEAEGMAWMMALLSPVVASVRGMVHVQIGDNATAALVSFAYNCGTGALRGSTLMRLLNQREPFGVVADQFGGWVHDAKGNVEAGLIRRRKAEAALFARPDGVVSPGSAPSFIADLSGQNVVPDEADLLDTKFNPPE